MRRHDEDWRNKITGRLSMQTSVLYRSTNEKKLFDTLLGINPAAQKLTKQELCPQILNHRIHGHSSVTADKKMLTDDTELNTVGINSIYL